MSILKLDDLIKESNDELELKGKLFHFDFSFKSMIKFQKWSKQFNLEEDLNEDALEKLIGCVITESSQFIELLNKENVKSQTLIVNKVIEVWTKEMFTNVNNQGNDKKK